MSSGEGLKYIPGPILSKSQSKTIPVAIDDSPTNLPKVQYALMNSSDTQ